MKFKDSDYTADGTNCYLKASSNFNFIELFQKQAQLTKEMNERFNKTSGTFSS